MGARCCGDGPTNLPPGERREQNTPTGASNFDNKPVLVSAPWIHQAWLFEGEECRGVRWETKPAGSTGEQRHRGTLDLSQPGFLFTETHRLLSQSLLFPAKTDLRRPGRVAPPGHAPPAEARAAPQPLRPTSAALTPCGPEIKREGGHPPLQSPNFGLSGLQNHYSVSLSLFSDHSGPCSLHCVLGLRTYGSRTPMPFWCLLPFTKLL